MMKRIAGISAAALVLCAAFPLGASAQSDASAWRERSAHQHTVGQDAGSREADFRYGFYLNAPGYAYAPQGGNSGGANFPHSGT